MAYINTGDLDTLVTINRCVITKDAEGGKKSAYTHFRDVYAKVDRRIDEQVSIGNLEGGDFVNLTIYKIAELNSTWQVVIGSQKYEITGIDMLERLSPFCVLTVHAVD